jgi:hypothetical protein
MQPVILGGLAKFCRYNSTWTRDIQNVVFAVLFCGWLGGMGVPGEITGPGKLLTIEEVGLILNGMSEDSIKWRA